ncbi:hypothetical protein C9F07_08405 [Salmonella enterica subsp. enterica serovar Poona]|uniref:Uncharacterized protein n=1 Tax=Salmonella enterica subsp. enterica serovar Poona TaxID=436295 RepID=A0A4Z0NZ85_SALET|nr:hypothetical protein C9F07_08405 [Salmonella enterica subsp. enterica serovar Poona]
MKTANLRCCAPATIIGFDWAFIEGLCRLLLRIFQATRRARNADANGHLQYTPALILKLARAIQSAS